MRCENEHVADRAMFDAFCKEVLRNTVFNYKRKKKRQSEREFVTPDPEQYLVAADAVFDNYATDHLYISFDGRLYPLDNEILYNAMLTLPPHFLGVLLLKFWNGMKDASIAAYFNVTTRTVRSWRRRAINEMQRWYQESES